jgi:hypothetical protein
LFVLQSALSGQGNTVGADDVVIADEDYVGLLELIAVCCGSIRKTLNRKSNRLGFFAGCLSIICDCIFINACVFAAKRLRRWPLFWPSCFATRRFSFFKKYI